jgi:phosphopantothenoylcysteine synthetase/decarboxylase
MLRYNRVLITSGGTREAIDGVRYLTNFSTGRTGATLADMFTNCGIDVTYLVGQGAARPQIPCRLEEFESFQDLDQSVYTILQSQPYDAVVHLAAVSDFSISHLTQEERTIAASAQGKLNSDADLSIHLKRNHKIVDGLRNYSTYGDIKVVAFKLTNTTDERERALAVTRILEKPSVDFVVHNDMSDIISDENHRFCIYQKDGSLPQICANKYILGRKLIQVFNLLSQKTREVTL